MGKVSMTKINEEIKANPKSVPILLTRANIYMLDGDVENSRLDFNKVVELDPRCAKAHIGLGRLFKFDQKWPQALVEFKKAEQVSKPEFAIDAVWEAAFMHRELAQYPQALVEYNQVINSRLLNKNRLPFALLQRGELYLRSGQCKLALADFDRCLKLDPTLMLGFLNRGRAHAADGQREKAIADYTKVITTEYKKLAVDDLGTHKSVTNKALLERSDIYAKMGRHDLAEQDRATARKNDRLMLDIAPFSSH